MNEYINVVTTNRNHTHRHRLRQASPLFSAFFFLGAVEFQMLVHICIGFMLFDTNVLWLVKSACSYSTIRRPLCCQCAYESREYCIVSRATIACVCDEFISLRQYRSRRNKYFFLVFEVLRKFCSNIQWQLFKQSFRGETADQMRRSPK